MRPEQMTTPHCESERAGTAATIDVDARRGQQGVALDPSSVIVTRTGQMADDAGWSLHPSPLQAQTVCTRPLRQDSRADNATAQCRRCSDIDRRGTVSSEVV